MKKKKSNSILLPAVLQLLWGICFFQAGEVGGMKQYFYLVNFITKTFY